MYQNVRNIWCAVLNYKDTAKEVNAHPPLEPIFFLKAGSTITDEKQPIILPSFSQEVLYEVEIALQFNEKLQVDRVGLGLDLTAGDQLAFGINILQMLGSSSLINTKVKSS